MSKIQSIEKEKAFDEMLGYNVWYVFVSTTKATYKTIMDIKGKCPKKSDVELYFKNARKDWSKC